MFYTDSISKAFLTGRGGSIPGWEFAPVDRWNAYEDPTYMGFYFRFLPYTVTDGNDLDYFPQGLFLGASGYTPPLPQTGNPAPETQEHPDSAVSYLVRRGEHYRADMMREFRDGMIQIATQCPWVFEKVTGMNELWKFDPKIPFRGKEKKLVFDCTESINGRMTYLIDLYRKAAFDTAYMRHMLPDNQRYFSMELTVTEIRNMQQQFSFDPFIPKSSIDFETVTFLNFRLDFCEFDFFGESPAYLDTLMTYAGENAKLKIPIKVGRIKEVNRYGLLDAVLSDTFGISSRGKEQSRSSFGPLTKAQNIGDELQGEKELDNIRGRKRAFRPSGDLLVRGDMEGDPNILFDLLPSAVADILSNAGLETPQAAPGPESLLNVNLDAPPLPAPLPPVNLATGGLLSNLATGAIAALTNSLRTAVTGKFLGNVYGLSLADLVGQLGGILNNPIAAAQGIAANFASPEAVAAGALGGVTLSGSQIELVEDLLGKAQTALSAVAGTPLESVSIADLVGDQNEAIKNTKFSQNLEGTPGKTILAGSDAKLAGTPGKTVLESSDATLAGNPGTTVLAGSDAKLDGNPGSTVLVENGAVIDGNPGSAVLVSNDAKLDGNPGKTILDENGAVIEGNPGAAILVGSGANLGGNPGKTTLEENGAVIDGNPGEAKLEGANVKIDGNPGAAKLEGANVKIDGSPGEAKLEGANVKIEGNPGKTMLEENGAVIEGKPGETKLEGANVKLDGKPGETKLDGPNLKIEGNPGKTKLEENGAVIEGNPGETKLTGANVKLDGKPGETKLDGPNLKIEGNPGKTKLEGSNAEIEGDPGKSKLDGADVKIEGKPGIANLEGNNIDIEGDPGKTKLDGNAAKIEGNPGKSNLDSPEITLEGTPGSVLLNTGDVKIEGNPGSTELNVSNVKLEGSPGAVKLEGSGVTLDGILQSTNLSSPDVNLQGGQEKISLDSANINLEGQLDNLKLNSPSTKLEGKLGKEKFDKSSVKLEGNLGKTKFTQGDYKSKLEGTPGAIKFNDSTGKIEGTPGQVKLDSGNAKVEGAPGKTQLTGGTKKEEKPGAARLETTGAKVEGSLGKEKFVTAGIMNTPLGKIMFGNNNSSLGGDLGKVTFSAPTTIVTEGIGKNEMSGAVPIVTESELGNSGFIPEKQPEQERLDNVGFVVPSKDEVDPGKVDFAEPSKQSTFGVKNVGLEGVASEETLKNIDAKPINKPLITGVQTNIDIDKSDNSSSVTQ